MPKPKAVPLDHLRGKKRPVIRFADIFTEPDIALPIAEAKQAADVAANQVRLRPGDLDAEVQRDKAQSELERLRAEAIENEHVVRYYFRGIGPKAFETLKSEHPPTEEQQRQAREEALAAGLKPEQGRLSYNADTFPPAILSRASLDPRLTLADAQEICSSEDWNEAEVVALFAAAMSAQQTRDVADLGKSSNGSEPTQG